MKIGDVIAVGRWYRVEQATRVCDGCAGEYDGTVCTALPDCRVMKHGKVIFVETTKPKEKK